jgi:dipeptidyl aminopeptidase/acylaminoacyl peptidase
MKASDLPLLFSVSRPTIHADGRRAVVAASRPDLDSDSYAGQLWSVPLDGGAARRITRGKNDSRPRFSPDGRLLAFVRSGDGPGQLYLIPADGGEPVQLTDTELGVGSYRWSPDSRQIAFTTRVPEVGRYGSITGLGSDAEPPRHITTFRYQANGLGYTVDRRSHIFLIAVPDVDAEPHYALAPSAENPSPESLPTVPNARQLTSGDFDHDSLAFAPDGATLAFVSARHPSRDLDLRTDIFTLALMTDDAEPQAATAGERNFDVQSMTWAADGALYFVGTDLGDTALDFLGKGGQLYVIAAPGEEPRLLTDPATIDLLQEDDEPTIAADDVIVQNRRHGRVELLRISRDGTLTALATGDVEIGSHDACGETVVVGFTSGGTTGELGIIENGGVRALTDFSAPLRASGLIEPIELTIQGRDGYPVHGWVLTPAGDGPHPVLLNIHGGPFAQYSVSLFDEVQVYADAGYAVVMCNPRGAAGYGEAHARAIRRKLGTVDLDDVIDFLDGALAHDPSLDASRVGIMGGSYGGYLTAWAIAHDHRFAGAIVERGFLDPEGFIGTSDIGSFFSDEYAGTDPALITSQSPQAVVDQVTTPTLVIHSANDLRCPLGQGERYYAALKRNGVHTELLVFPGENHELSRTGRPRHRLQRFEAILAWWGTYLPVGASAASRGVDS